MGEEAKDCEREESEGGTKGLANFGGGFEVEALASIAQGDGLNRSRLADHMSRAKTRPASFASSSLRVLEPPTQCVSRFYSQILAPLPLCKVTAAVLRAAG
jgi:hypothetical protein